MIDQTNNTHVIYAYLVHPDLWENINADGISKYNFIPEISQSVKWLFYSAEGEELNGLIRMDLRSTSHFVFHVFMQKIDRKYKQNMIREFYKYIFTDSNYKKGYVEFPSHRNGLKEFAEEMGMEYEATMKECVQYNGSIRDLIIYGIEHKKALSDRDWEGNSTYPFL